MRPSIRIPSVLAVAVLTVASCDRGRDPEGAARREATGADVAASYAPALGVDLERMTRTPSGLYVEEQEAGTGETASAGDRVSVHYAGWLPDGTQFDSSRQRAPFDFVLGEGMVIQGWDEGVAGMREGGRRKLVIPPHLGYGPGGIGGVIPPNATLVFDVELLRVN
jgi:FKBP-type peptidyl-prolyl cis-trans isomerase FkpA